MESVEKDRLLFSTNAATTTAGIFAFGYSQPNGKQEIRSRTEVAMIAIAGIIK
jgi:hypothetical protein